MSGAEMTLWIVENENAEEGQIAVVLVKAGTREIAESLAKGRMRGHVKLASAPVDPSGPDRVLLMLDAPSSP